MSFLLRFMKITKEHLDIVKRELVAGSNLKEACKVVNFTPDSVSKKLRNEGFRCESFNKFSHLDYKYFEKIDSEKKAYFLGLILSDGNISKTTNRVVIGLNKKDSYILDAFKKDIGSDNAIRYYSVFDKRKNKYNSVSVFQISNINIKNDLNRLGISHDKSNKFYFTTIAKNKNFNHFLRGLVDGDGYISKNKNRVSLISTKEFLDFIQNYFRFKRTKLYKLKDNIYRLSLQNRKSVLKFLDFIYNKSTVHLTRKYKAYLNIKDNLKIHNAVQVIPCILRNKKTKEDVPFNCINDALKYLNTTYRTFFYDGYKHPTLSNYDIIKGKKTKKLIEIIN